MEGPYKELAQKFLPGKLRYLLIAESPPYTPPDQKLKYFYNYKNASGGQVLLSSVSYAFLDKKFYVDSDNKKEFLNLLMENGIFWVDATYEPINKIKDKKLRQSKIERAYPELKKNIIALNLSGNVKILLIHKNVIKAIGGTIRKDFITYKCYDIGFPSYYNDDNFTAKIRKAIED